MLGFHLLVRVALLEAWRLGTSACLLERCEALLEGMKALPQMLVLVLRHLNLTLKFVEVLYRCIHLILILVLLMLRKCWSLSVLHRQLIAINRLAWRRSLCS